MPNRYLIAAVHLVDRRGNHSLTIRAGVCESAELLAAQAVAEFCADHVGFIPAAVASVEVSLEALESSVAMLKDEASPEGLNQRRRGRKPRLAPGMIPAKQEDLSDEERATLQDYLDKHDKQTLNRHQPPAWGKPGEQDSAPGPVNFEDAPPDRGRGQAPDQVRGKPPIAVEGKL